MMEQMLECQLAKMDAIQVKMDVNLMEMKEDIRASQAIAGSERRIDGKAGSQD
jgi:hypothetical protein